MSSEYTDLPHQLITAIGNAALSNWNNTEVRLLLVHATCQTEAPPFSEGILQIFVHALEILVDNTPRRLLITRQIAFNRVLTPYLATALSSALSLEAEIRLVKTPVAIKP